MKREEIDKINKLTEVHSNNPAAVANAIVSDGQLTRKILNDWLLHSLPNWFAFYGELSENVMEGHLAGPSPTQARILKRMRDKGHRVAPVRGFFRWIGGNDVRINRQTIRLMIERGWLCTIDSSVVGLEYMVSPTRMGMVALENYELDTKKDRAYP